MGPPGRRAAIGHGGRATGWIGAALLALAAPSAAAQALPSWGHSAQRCLGDDSSAFVTLRRFDGQEATVLVVHRRDGSMEQCLFVPDGRIALSPWPGARPPRADEPAFFLERRCPTARPAQDAQGRAIGWFATPVCRE